MTKAEIFEILEAIKCFYPNFEINQKKINAWSNVLKDDDFKIVNAKVEKHATEKKFPPTISEIRQSVNPYKNDYLEKLKKWEKEAKYAKSLPSDRE